MRTPLEHLENIKGKPHHVRKKIAFGTAFAGSALIALVWLAASLSTNAFAIQGSSFAQSVGRDTIVASDSMTADQNLAGAAAARTFDSSVPIHIEIVNVASSSPLDGKKSEQTILPF